MPSIQSKLTRLLARSDEQRLKDNLEVERKLGEVLDYLRWIQDNTAGTNHNLVNAYSHLQEYFSHVTSTNKCAADSQQKPIRSLDKGGSHSENFLEHVKQEFARKQGSNPG